MTANKITCSECKNDIVVQEGVTKGDVIECEFCGVEIEVTSVDDVGNIEFTMIEEEK